MSFSLALALKVVGGLIVGGTHRTLARAAREESFQWWLTAMFVPGGSIIYGLRRSREFLSIVLIMFAGFAVAGGGVALGISQRVQEARQMATVEAHDSGDNDSEDEDDDDGRAASTPTEIPATPVPTDPTPTTAPALPLAASVPKHLQPQIEKLLQRLSKTFRRARPSRCAQRG